MSEKPSLLSLTVSDQRRGAEVQAERIGSALEVRGWDLDLVALSGGKSGARIAAETLAGAETGRWSLALLRRLRRRVVHRAPQVIIANGSATLRYAVGALAGLRARPRLVHVSIGEPGYWLRGGLHHRLQRYLLHKVDHIIAVSRATAEQLTTVHGLAESRIDVVLSGMPDDFLAVRHEPRAGEMRLLFMGSLSPEKDPVAAVAALARLHKSTPAQLRFAGDGSLRGTLMRRAAAAGVADAVEIVDPTDDVLSLLAWADVLVMTSRTEGLPGCAIEAAGAGVPTVAYAVGGLGEVVVDGVTGSLVSPSDVAGLAAALADLGRDESMRARMGAAARDRFTELFRLDRAADQYDEILRRAIA